MGFGIDLGETHRQAFNQDLFGARPLDVGEPAAAIKNHSWFTRQQRNLNTSHTSSPSDIRTAHILHVRVFYFLATSEEIAMQIPKSSFFREQFGITGRPRLVWQPFLPAWQPENLDSSLKACKLVDFLFRLTIWG